MNAVVKIQDQKSQPNNSGSRKWLKPKRPSDVSEEVPMSAARGPIKSFTETIQVPDGEDGWRLVEMPYRAGKPGRVRDVFDTICENATRRGGLSPLTEGQVAAGRSYRDLVEQQTASGMSCSSAFSDHVGGGSGRDAMDLYIQRGRRLDAFHSAIGTGCALTPRGDGSHSFDRGTRRAITEFELVHRVCVAQQPMSAILRAYGWAGGKNIKTLLDALSSALGRMEGM